MQTLMSHLETANKSSYPKPNLFLFSGNLEEIIDGISQIGKNLVFTVDRFGDFILDKHSKWSPPTRIGRIQKLSDEEYGFILSNEWLDDWIHTIWIKGEWEKQIPNLHVKFKCKGQKQSGLEFTKYFDVTINDKTYEVTGNNGFGESAESLFMKRVRRLFR